MEEEQEEQEVKRTSWAIWIVLPVCVVGTVLVTKWFMKNNSRPPAGSTMEYNEVYTPQKEDREPSPASQGSGTSGRPVRQAGTDISALISSGGGEAGTAKPSSPSAVRAKPEVADEGTAKEQSKFGFTYGAISAAVGKAMNNPKAVSAMLNNKYVINGFMSRNTVKNATGNKAAALDFLKDGRNVSAFFDRPIVQRGLNNAAVLNAVVSSGLMTSLLNTPGGKAVLNDPAAMREVIASNPQLGQLLMNPNVVNVLISNPKTAGLIGQVGAGAVR